MTVQTFTTQAVLEFINTTGPAIAQVMKDMKRMQQQVQGVQTSFSTFSTHSKQQIEQVSLATQQFHNRLLGVSVFMGGLTHALAGVGKFARDFEESVTIATTKLNFKSQEEFTKGLVILTKQAKELGAATSFSASQVAQAQDVFASKGFSIKQMGSMMSDALNFAKASSMGLADSISIATATMSAFQLGSTGKELRRVSDILLNIKNGSAATIERLGYVVSNVGSLAKSAGATLPQVGAMAGLLADLGVSGEVTATSLKNLFARLQQGSVIKQFKAMGIAVNQIGANGKEKMRPILDIMANMETTMAGMGNPQKAAFLQKAFGDSFVHIQSLLNSAKEINGTRLEGVALIRETVKAFSETGSTDFAVLQMRKTHAEQIALFNSALDALKLTLGDLYNNTIAPLRLQMRNLLLHFEAFVQTTNGAEITKFIAMMLGLVGAVGAVSVAFSLFSFAVSTPVLLISGLLGSLYYAYQNNFGGMQEILGSFLYQSKLVIKGVMQLISSLSSSIGKIDKTLLKELEAHGLDGLVLFFGQLAYFVKQTVRIVGIGIGHVLSFASNIVNLIKEFPVFSTFLVLTFGVFKALSFAIAGVKGLYTAIAGVKGLSMVIRGLQAVSFAFMVSNPLVLGISAAIALAMTFVLYLKEIKEWFDKLDFENSKGSRMNQKGNKRRESRKKNMKILNPEISVPEFSSDQMTQKGNKRRESRKKNMKILNSEISVPEFSSDQIVTANTPEIENNLKEIQQENTQSASNSHQQTNVTNNFHTIVNEVKDGQDAAKKIVAKYHHKYVQNMQR